MLWGMVKFPLTQIKLHQLKNVQDQFIRSKLYLTWPVRVLARKFIQNSAVAAVLTDMTRKGAPSKVKWSPAA